MLDDNYFEGWGRYVQAKSDILLEGSFGFKYNIRFLEKGFYYDVVTGALSLFAFYIVVVAYFILNSDLELVFKILLLVFFFLIPFLYEYIWSRYQSRTKYAITAKHVLIKKDYWINQVVYPIPLDSIYKLAVIEYENSKSAVYLFTDFITKLKTYHTNTGALQEYPTIENIDLDQANKIKSLLSSKISGKKKPFEIKNIAANKLKLLKQFLLVIFVFQSIYTADFYVIPSFTDVDVLKTGQRIIASGRDLGGEYLTKKGYEFGLHDFSNLSEGEIELEVTRIFKNVKSVRFSNKDYSHKLLSSLNGKIIFWLYFILYVLTGIYLYWLSSGKEISKDDFIMMLFSSIGLTIILGLWWMMIN